jgi:preprotein translocase subunit YajC
VTGRPDLPIDPSLERRLDAELRREMREAEEQGRQLAARRRTLVEALAESVQRGDRVTVVSGAAQFSGVPVYARGDLVSLESASALVEAHLDALDSVIVDARAAGAGRAMVHEAESFKARLGLIELAGESVEVVTRGGTSRARGRVATVARDHLVLQVDAAREVLLPMDGIAFVVRAR